MHWNTHALATQVQQPFNRAWGVVTRTWSRNPFLVKTLTSGMGFAFGDVLMQLGTRKHKHHRPLDWQRSAKMGAIGLTVAGPVGFGFILWMEGNIMTAAPASRLAVSTKITLDQVLGCIIWQAALMALDQDYRKGAQNVWNKIRRPNPNPKVSTL